MNLNCLFNFKYRIVKYKIVKYKIVRYKIGKYKIGKYKIVKYKIVKYKIGKYKIGKCLLKLYRRISLYCSIYKACDQFIARTLCNSLF